MSDSASQRDNLRNSKQGVTAMPMPSGSGAMLVCKVPVKRPMPCAVILIHGVNDDGHCFPTIDQEICNGLNERLGRDDLFPHQWGHASDNDTTATPLDRSPMTIQKEGRSPVIPFHWGYRPVDKATYDADQQRYLAEVEKRRRNPELPYSTFYRDLHKDPKAGWSRKDNLGNWLDAQFAKDGGTFSNATTNLIDMWGPGRTGSIYGVTMPLTRTFLSGGDYSHPIYENPHRIYFVHAAHRLADLILRIRRDGNYGPDAINIIAHSQGTLITMLTNFLVREAGERPADCVILCNSPYALKHNAMDHTFGGPIQADEARQQTLASFCDLMWEQRAKVDYDKMIARGVAKRAAWELPQHGRDNFGMVYNYFCPNDQVVSLYNIEGMGWQGLSDDELNTVGAKYRNFRQRAFAQGAIVGDPAGPRVFSMSGKDAESPDFKKNAAFGSRKRTINADPLPVPFAFHVQTGQDHLGEHLGGTALAVEGRQKLRCIVDSTSGAETVLSTNAEVPGSPVLGQTDSIQTLLRARGYPHTILNAWVLRPSESRFLVERYETQQEALSRNEAKKTDWSQHSAIVENGEVARKCMAYDLAINLNAGYDDEKFWWDKLYRADWRHLKNPDVDATAYYRSGILPDPTKKQMNRPILPAGVVDIHGAPSNPAARDFGVAGAVGVSEPVGSTWPLPEPDVR